MKWFFYVIKDKEHQIKKDYIEAESEEQLKEHFKKEGCLVYSINETDKPESDKKTDKFYEIIKKNKASILTLLIVIVAFGFGLRKRSQVVVEKAVFEVEESIPGVKESPIETKKITFNQEETIVEDIYLEEEGQPMKGDVAIKLKGQQKPRTANDLGDSYRRARDYYVQANRRFSRNLPSKKFYRRAIKFARFALLSATKSDIAEEMKALIRDCQEKLN